MFIISIIPKRFINANVKCYLILTFHCFTVCLSLDDSCFNGTIEICCANFEVIDDMCKQCNIGFRSKEGERCEECPSGWYGYKCGSSCDCRENQRCDNIEGCANDIQRNASLTVTAFYGDVTSDRSQQVTMRMTEATTDNASNDRSHRQVTVRIEDENTARNTPKDLIIYCLAVACFLPGFLLVLYLCFRFHKRKCRSQSPTLTQITETASGNRLIRNITENIELKERIYHEIDERMMEDRKPVVYPCRGYLDVIDSSVSLIQRNNIDGYLHPVSAMANEKEGKNDSYVQKTNSLTACSDSSSSSSSSSLPDIDNRGYYHMYQLLDKRRRSLPNYVHIDLYSRVIKHTAAKQGQRLTTDREEKKKSPKFSTNNEISCRTQYEGKANKSETSCVEQRVWLHINNLQLSNKWSRHST